MFSTTEIPGSLITATDALDAAQNAQVLEKLVAEWGIDEVHLVMKQLETKMVRDLGAKSRTPAWRAKQHVMLTAVMVAKVGLRKRIAVRNQQEAADAAIYSKFAERLAEALYLVDPAALEAVEGVGDASATEWLHVRVERRARLALARAAKDSGSTADESSSNQTTGGES